MLVPPHSADLTPEQFIDALGKDKKRIGTQLALVMMSDGFVFQRVNDMRPEEVGVALEELSLRLVEHSPNGSEREGAQ